MKSHVYHLLVKSIFWPGDTNKTSLINKCFRVTFSAWKWKRAHNHTCKKQTYADILTYIKQVRMNADEKICLLIFFILFYNFPKSLLHLQNKVVNLFSTVNFLYSYCQEFHIVRIYRTLYLQKKAALYSTWFNHSATKGCTNKQRSICLSITLTRSYISKSITLQFPIRKVSKEISQELWDYFLILNIKCSF